jgi:hypothetical protein
VAIELPWLLGGPPAFSFVVFPTPEALVNSPGVTLPGLYGTSDCPVVGYSEAALLAILERSYPAGYLAAMRLSPTGGYELIQAAAKTLRRASDAVAELYCCSLLAFAHGPAFSTGLVEFFRLTADEGAITIRAGTHVRTGRTGRRYVTASDAVFGALDLGPVTVQATAIEPDQTYDVPGVVITAGGEAIAGEIDEIAELGAGSGFDPNMQVRQMAAFVGGRTPCLDGLGEDVGVPRFAGESDDRYRLRILQRPDTVSPDAIERGLDLLLGPLGLHACLRQVGTERLPGFFYDAGSSSDSPQVPTNNYAYDMDFTVRPADRYKLLLDIGTFRGFFVVGVPAIPDIAEFGMFYDTATTDTFPLQNAYDTTSPTAQNVAYDGFSTLNSSIYQAIHSMLDEKRAAGVSFELLLDPLGCN